MIEPTASVTDPALRLDLESALQRLTDRQRTALLLRAEGYRLREIGAALGTGRAAVCRLLGRARERLRATM